MLLACGLRHLVVVAVLKQLSIQSKVFLCLISKVYSVAEDRDRIVRFILPPRLKSFIFWFPPNIQERGGKINPLLFLSLIFLLISKFSLSSIFFHCKINQILEEYLEEIKYEYDFYKS